MIWKLLILFFMQSAVKAAIVSEEVIVKKIKWHSSGRYRLTLFERAGVYYSPPLHLECLSASLQENKAVLISFDLRGLVIKDCQWPLSNSR